MICTTELAVLPSYGHSHITNGCGSVISEQADIPSYIIRGPDDCTVLVGGKVTLDALFCAHPKPKIKWLKAVSVPIEFFNDPLILCCNLLKYSVTEFH